MNNRLDPSLRKALQNPDSLSLRYMPIFAMITFPVSVFVDTGTHSSSAETLEWILAKAIGYAGLLIFYYGIKSWSTSKDNITVSIPLLFILSGFGGLFQGVLVSAAIASLPMNHHDPFAWWVRPVTGFIMALSWLPINAVATVTFHNFRIQRTELLARSNKLHEFRLRQSGLATSVRENIEKSIIEDLAWSQISARQKFERLTHDGLNSHLPAGLVREYATGDLRELSHKLWEKSKPTAKPIATQATTFQDFVTLYKIGLNLPPISALVFTITTCTLIVPFALRGAPLTQSLLLGSIFVLTVFGVARVSEILWKKFRKYAVIILPSRVILASAISLILFGQLRQILIPEWAAPFGLHSIGAFILMCSIGITLSIAKSALYDHDEIIQALMNSIDREKAAITLAQMEIAQVSRGWAQYIHSSLQAKLLAMAIILEESVGDNNLAKKQQALDDAHLLLSSDFSAPVSPSSRNIKNELLFRCQLWGGIVEIEIESSISQAAPGIQVNAVGDAVEEALANAVRHGHASKINIEMHLTEIGDLACAITDNGDGISVDSRPGLGSAIFESITGGNWSRTARHDGPGTRLNLVIPALELPPERGGSSVG